MLLATWIKAKLLLSNVVYSFKTNNKLLCTEKFLNFRPKTFFDITVLIFLYVGCWRAVNYTRNWFKLKSQHRAHFIYFGLKKSLKVWVYYRVVGCYCQSYAFKKFIRNKVKASLFSAICCSSLLTSNSAISDSFSSTHPWISWKWFVTRFQLKLYI